MGPLKVLPSTVRVVPAAEAAAPTRAEADAIPDPAAAMVRPTAQASAPPARDLRCMTFLLERPRDAAHGWVLVTDEAGGPSARRRVAARRGARSGSGGEGGVGRVGVVKP